MRSYSALLIFESLFDSVPSGDADLDNLCRSIFEPELTIVEDDCQTRLGQIFDVDYEVEGRVELATGLPIPRTRIEQLLASGHYKVRTRSLSTCVSKGGVCKECYQASRPEQTVEVGDLVRIRPEYDIGADVVSFPYGGQTWELGISEERYDIARVYEQGQLQDPASYTISGTSLTFAAPWPNDTNLVVRFSTISRAPFMSWLAHTYSGSLLGVKPLPSDLLPVRSLLLSEQVSQSVLETVIQDTKGSGVIPPDMLRYLDQTKDPLEQALFLISLRSIYGNATI